jgi:transcription initiation factor TFIID subunit 1
MMKLTGFGDPSGCGEAYNFLREADTRVGRSTSVGAGDGALNAQIKKITGTENDLRKLTMKQMASLLRSYGMKDKQIAVLKRWDRVHVIRDLSTKAASDGMGDELERFARGEKIRLSDQRQNYTQRIQEIWRRQVAALTADVGREVAARSELVPGLAEDMAEDGVSDADAEKISGSNKDSDSSDDDDFLAEIEMEMATTGETNRLVSGLRDNGGSALDSQELNKDAREFAALQRQREEERNISEGIDKKSSALGVERSKFKVVRRKITKASNVFSIFASHASQPDLTMFRCHYH